MTRNDDMGLILAKAKMNGFFQDIRDEELDSIQQAAKKLFKDDNSLISGVVSGSIMPSAMIPYAMNGPTAWFYQDYSVGAKFNLAGPTTFSHMYIPCGNSSGNIEVAIYATTRTDVNSFTQVKVLTSGVIPCPALVDSGAIVVPFNTVKELPAGEYTVALWVDNVIATFINPLNNSLKWGGQALGSFPGDHTLGMPGVKVGDVYGGRTFVGSLITAIPDRARAVLFGDSITVNSGWFSVGNALSSTKYNLTYNAGIGGNTTTQMLARIQTDVIAKSPDLVTVLGGTNDLGQTFDPVVTRGNLQAIIDTILKSTSANIVIGTILPRGSVGGDPPVATMNAGRMTINNWIRSLSSSRVKVVDWSPAMSIGNDDLTYNTALFSDHVHPNDAGNIVMGNVLANVL